MPTDCTGCSRYIEKSVYLCRLFHKNEQSVLIDTDPMNRSKGKVSPKTPRSGAKQPPPSGTPLPRGAQSSTRRVPNSTGPRDSSNAQQFTARPNRPTKAAVSFKIVETDEYVADVNGSTGTTPVVTTYRYNPGNSTTFPWLSKEAAQWEKWVQIGTPMLYYKPQVSGFATNGQAGKVMFGFDYDPHDAPPVTRANFESSDSHADCMPYQEITLPLDADLINNGPGKRKNVRPGMLPGGADIEAYDGGNFYVGTVNNAATTLIGEIRIKATFRFEAKVLEPASGAPANNQVAWFQSTTAENAAATTVAKTLLLATATTNGISVVNTNGSIVPQAGNYLLDCNAVITYDGGGDDTKGVIDVQKNGVSVYQVSPPTHSQSTGVVGTASLGGSSYVSMNGTTDTLTVVATLTYSAGTPTIAGGLRITAI